MSRMPIVTTAAAALAVSAVTAPALGAGQSSVADLAMTAQGAAAGAAAGAVARKRRAVYSDPEWLPVREQSAVHCLTVMRSGGCAPSGYPAMYIVPRQRWNGPPGSIPDPIYAAGFGIAHVGAKGYTCTAGRRNPSRGNWVWIDHGNRQVTLYFHLARVMVRNGQQVTPDTILGPMGRTGKCKGVYLHYERRIGKAAGRPDKALPLMINKACHGSELVRYPDILGVRNWADVPYNSIVWSDGTDCA